MIEVLHSTDPVVISFADSLLDDAGIDHISPIRASAS
jgi:hypothetical protein